MAMSVLTVGSLKKFLADADDHDVVTVSDGGDYINVTAPDSNSGMCIWTGGDDGAPDDQG